MSDRHATGPEVMIDTAGGMRLWQDAMTAALYGPAGFFVRAGVGPAAHFRTSAHTSPIFTAALANLLQHLDRQLGHPDPLTVVDIGAGRGELLTGLTTALPTELTARLRPVAVELAPAPTPPVGAGIAWQREPPTGVVGLLLATEWLDNVPVAVVEADSAGVARYVLVDPATGVETLGEPVVGPDAAWLARWWPLPTPGARAEVGLPRDQAWAAAVATLERGAALAVDYGHQFAERPPLGTLTGYRAGRQVPPIPDGSCDLTAHVAIDAVAQAGQLALLTDPQQPPTDGPVLVSQATALRALGMTGTRPPLTLASRDPAGYLRQLATASAATELTDPAGLGGHHWLLQPVRLSESVTGWLA